MYVLRLLNFLLKQISNILLQFNRIFKTLHILKVKPHVFVDFHLDRKISDCAILTIPLFEIKINGFNKGIHLENEQVWNDDKCNYCIQCYFPMFEQFVCWLLTFILDIKLLFTHVTFRILDILLNNLVFWVSLIVTCMFAQTSFIHFIFDWCSEIVQAMGFIACFKSHINNIKIIWISTVIIVKRLSTIKLCIF